MERRGQQPEDAEPPGKDGAGGPLAPPPPVNPLSFPPVNHVPRPRLVRLPLSGILFPEHAILTPRALLCTCRQFLEVTCRSSGKVRRFSAGTTARYALHAINRKLEPGAPPALHVEAVRDGEEPVSFGPSAALADYGRGWRLQTVTAQDAPGTHHAPRGADTVRDDWYSE